MDELYPKNGSNYRMSARYLNLEAVAVYDEWNCEKLLTEIKYDEEQEEQIKQHNITVILSYVYSLSVWDKIDKK